MPNSSYRGGADFIDMLRGGTTVTFNDDVFGVGTKEEHAAAFIPFLQDQIDFRQRLNTLPTDDPDRTTDPAKPWLFWDGPGQPGNTDLVSRSDVITNVVWDGTRYVVSVRRAHI